MIAMKNHPKGKKLRIAFSSKEDDVKKENSVCLNIQIRDLKVLLHNAGMVYVVYATPGFSSVLVKDFWFPHTPSLKLFETIYT